MPRHNPWLAGRQTRLRSIYVMSMHTIDELVRLVQVSGQPADLRDPRGRVVGYLVPAALWERVATPAPGPVPRRLRRKQRLSKRQRDAAKRERLRGEAGSHVPVG